MTARAFDAPGQAYGLPLRVALPLPVDLPPPNGAGRPMLIRRGRTAHEPGSVVIWRARIDGRRVVVERSPTEAVHVRFGDDADFRIDTQAAIVTCSPRSEEEPLRWQRFLLDTVLWSAALVQGQVALHGAAVADDAGAVAIVGGTGGGKTSLALALLRRGGALVADDVVVVSPGHRAVLAHPAPPVMNLGASARARLTPRLGTSLGKLDDEEWVAISQSVQGAVPLRAVAVLSRVDDTHRVRRLDETQSFFALDAHSLRLPGLPRGRARTRFETLAEVAARVPVVEVRVPRSLPPDAIADVLDAHLPNDGIEAGGRDLDGVMAR